jgi:broad specificity phosphatase PhoE
MRRSIFCGLGGLAVCVLFSTAVLAGGHSAADFPLRVHVYEHNGHSHYYHQSLDAVDGEGRANLFENGLPQAFDFSYHCGERLQNSVGFETYMARWKKPGKTLEILHPQFGKPGAFDSCELKVDLKNNVVYRKHNGVLNEEQAAAFKEWMDKHQYDPEHGKDLPVATGADVNNQ